MVVAKVKSMKATERMAVKIRDNFYTIEYTEEREIPEDCVYDLEKEKQALFRSVNETVENQINEIVEGLRK